MSDVRPQCESIAENLSDAAKYEKMRREDLGEDFDENEHTGAYDWLSDVLDINYIINSDGTFKSAKVLVAFGGPNIWVDFESKTVDGYWWGDEAHVPFTDDMGIEDALEEMWETR